ncbi:MAG TPA: MFS transporter [Solirubrobacteraceae bacterium]|nr:MFS transporter [Solirubrobacteraceae bacterium]
MSATSADQGLATASWVDSPRAFLAPLALAQFICSFAGSNMNVMIATGFGVTAAGIGLLLGLVKAASSSAWAFAPELLLIGLGLGVMLTPSVNLVQSAFPEEKQGEISGLSRSISNLGSSFGTAIAGTILVSNLVSGNGTYVAAMIVLAAVAVAGLLVAVRLPANPIAAETAVAPPSTRSSDPHPAASQLGSALPRRCSRHQAVA